MEKKIVCSRCGTELDAFDVQQDFTIHKKVQYGSIYDGCTVHYQLCCDCFDHLVGECRVNPVLDNEEEVGNK